MDSIQENNEVEQLSWDIMYVIYEDETLIHFDEKRNAIIALLGKFKKQLLKEKKDNESGT